MSRRVVLDASAVVRLYVPDGPLPEGLTADVDAAARGDVVLLAPELVLAEVVQALRRKERARLLTAQESDEIRAAVLDLPLELVGHRALIEPAVALWRRTGLTVHDALYLALAVERGADLHTADEAVAAAFAAART